MAREQTSSVPRAFWISQSVLEHYRLGRPKPFSYRGYEGLVMAATSERDDPEVGLKAHSTSPERTVFTEPDNSDGWIATDYTVGIER